MNSDSHSLMGTILYSRMAESQGILLDRESFLKGNVIPDFSSYAILHPHFAQFSLGYIQHLTVALAKKHLESDRISREYSRQLGILCHYYTDFFCFAHRRYFRQNVVEHVKYENLLHTFFLSRREDLPEGPLQAQGQSGLSAQKLNEAIRKYQAEYRRSEPSMAYDIGCALQVCEELILSLYRISVRQNMEDTLFYHSVPVSAIMEFQENGGSGYENCLLYGHLSP